MGPGNLQMHGGICILMPKSIRQLYRPSLLHVDKAPIF